MISTILYLFFTFIYETDENVRYLQKVVNKKNLFFVGILSVTGEIAGSSSALPKNLTYFLLASCQPLMK